MFWTCCTFSNNSFGLLLCHLSTQWLGRLVVAAYTVTSLPAIWPLPPFSFISLTQKVFLHGFCQLLNQNYINYITMTQHSSHEPSICAECCSSTDISSLLIWPHHGRAHQLTLVTSAGKDCVQGRSADLPGTARWCRSVPSAAYTSRQHPDPTKTPVFHLGRSVRSCCQTAYCWTSCFLCHWCSCLERSSCRRHFSTLLCPLSENV